MSDEAPDAQAEDTPADSDPVDPVDPAKTLTSIFGVKLVRVIGLFCFVVVSLLLVAMIFTPESLDSAMARFAYLIAIAVFLSVFLFVLYPQETVASKGPWADLAIRVAGPAALLIAVFSFFNRFMPQPPSELRDGRHFLFSEKSGTYDDAYDIQLKAGHIESLLEEDDGFPAIPLEGELVGAAAIEVSSSKGTILGTIQGLDELGPPAPHLAGAKRQTDHETALRLGIYFATCIDTSAGLCTKRRDSLLAKSRLLEALGDNDAQSFTQEERHEGAMLLYRLFSNDETHACEDLARATQAISIHRQRGSFKHHELAELYNQLARSLDDEDMRMRARRNALHFYLRYLSAAPRADLARQVRALASDLIDRVAPQRKAELGQILRNSSKNELREASDSFAVVSPLSCA